MRAEKFILSEELLLDESQDNFYDTVSLNGLIDDDMISGAEEGFMRGYLEA